MRVADIVLQMALLAVACCSPSVYANELPASFQVVPGQLAPSGERMCSKLSLIVFGRAQALLLSSSTLALLPQVLRYST